MGLLLSSVLLTSELLLCVLLANAADCFFRTCAFAAARASACVCLNTVCVWDLTAPPGVVDALTALPAFCINIIWLEVDWLWTLCCWSGINLSKNVWLPMFVVTKGWLVVMALTGLVVVMAAFLLVLLCVGFSWRMMRGAVGAGGWPGVGLTCGFSSGEVMGMRRDASDDPVPLDLLTWTFWVMMDNGAVVVDEPGQVIQICQC